MDVNIEINNCKECHHHGSSGRFTKGGARIICIHPDAADCCDKKNIENFYREYPEYAKKFSNRDWKFHWYNRITDETNDIPRWCPLKHGRKY